MGVAEKLQLHAEKYFEFVSLVASEALKGVIVPFCKKNGLSFHAGNGTYIFTRLRGKQPYETIYQDLSLMESEWCNPVDNRKASPAAPEGWQQVLDVCNTDVPLCNGQSLGSMMEDYEGGA